MESKKRKRELEDHQPRITYHAPGRTFERIFKEESLKETQQVVRQKLGLPPTASVTFAQLREDKHIDLEDDDDFDALRVFARSVPSVDVRVTVSNDSAVSSTPQSAQGAKKKTKKRRESLGGSLHSPFVSQTPQPHPSPSAAPPTDQSKKRKITFGDSPKPTEGRLTPNSTSAIPPTSTSEPSAKKRRTNDGGAKGVAKPKSKVGSGEMMLFPEPSTPAVGDSSTKKRKTGAEKAAGVKSSAKAKSQVDSIETPNNAKPKSKVESGSGPTFTDQTDSTMEGQRQLSKEKKGRNGRRLSEVDRIADDVQASIPEGQPKSKKSKEGDVIVTLQPSAPATSSVVADVDRNKVDKSTKKKERASEVAEEPVPSTSARLSDLSSASVRKKPRKSTAKPLLGEEPSDVTSLVGDTTTGNGAKKEMAQSKSKSSTKQPMEDGSMESDEDVTSEDSSGMTTGKQAKARSTLKSAKDQVDQSIDDSRTGDGESTELPGDADTGASKKHKPKTKESKKTIPPAATTDSDSMLSAAATLVDSFPKKRRQSTTTREDALPADEVNGETKKSKSKSKKRQSEHTLSDIDPDEVSAAWDDIFATKSNRPLNPSPSFITASQGQGAAAGTPQNVNPEGTQLPMTSKPRRSQSKLRMSWGPEDIEEAEASDEPDSVAPHLPSSSPTAGNLITPVRPGNTKTSSATKKRRDPADQPCPLCLKRPFHLRYRCPVIEAGPDAIEKRLEELKSEDTGDHTLLVEELEHLLRTHRNKVKVNGPQSGSAAKSSFAEPKGNFSPMIATSTPAVRSSLRPIIPSDSRMSEVTVETRDEGSSNEGSDDGNDDDDDDDDTHSESEYPYKLPSAFGNVSFADMDLDAVIRGPMSQSKSILDEVPYQSDSDEEEDIQAEADVLDEDEDDRQYRMRSKKLEKAASSSDEGEDPDVPAGGGSKEDSDDEDVANGVSPKTLPLSVGDNRAIQAVDGLNGSAGSEVTEDDDRTKVAPSAENDEETDVSALEPVISSSQRKDALLIAALGDAVPISQSNNAPREVQPISDNPALRPAFPDSESLPQESMDVIPTSPCLTKGTSHNKHPNDDSDPIEPADDFLKSPPRTVGKLIPIVLLSPRSPGRATRMKDRSGKMASDTSKLAAPTEPDNGTAPSSQTMATDSTSVECNSSQNPETCRPRSPAGSNSVDVVPPPPAKKKPGRPAITAEEKAARDKAAADEKARKAEEKVRKAEEKARQAKEKARKAEEEKAQKAEAKARKAEETKRKAAETKRLAEEKALKAAEEKARKAEEKERKAEVARKKQAEKEEKARQAVPGKGTKTTKTTSTKSSKSLVKTSIKAAPPQPNTPEPSVRDVLHRSPSLDKWATIPASSPQVPETSLMLDQLRSSSPARASVTGDCQPEEDLTAMPQTVGESSANDERPLSAETNIQDNPLFFPSNSQVPFPYSQLQGGSVPTRGDDTPTESDSEGETPVRPKGKQSISLAPPQYRRLTDIASQTLFSQDIMSPTPSIPTPPINGPKDERNDSDDDEDEDDGSGSDSDNEENSHIPSSRRATTLRSRKGVGLLSYA